MINVAIIGCGLIGTQWDQPASADSASPHSLTHAAAFSKNPAAKLLALCDQDLGKAELAAARWNCARAFSSPASLFAACEIDLVVIAASSAARWSVLEPALAAGIKTFVIEKPLATTLQESKKLLQALDQASAKSLINFSRHWDPSMRAIRERILGRQFGAVQRLVGYYGKGITNNGSHMVDLAGFLCDAKPLRARALTSPLAHSEANWSKGLDCAHDAQVVYANSAGEEFQLTMLATDQSAFTCFEMRIIGRDGICDIALGGRSVTLRAIQDDPNYAGYRIPGVAAALDAHANEAMDLMAAEALELAQGRIARASCDAEDALRTAMAVEAVKISAGEGGRWVEVGELDGG